MDVLTFEACWAVNNEIIKQVTSSWKHLVSAYRQIRCQWSLRCTSELYRHRGVWTPPVLVRKNNDSDAGLQFLPNISLFTAERAAQFRLVNGCRPQVWHSPNDAMILMSVTAKHCLLLPLRNEAGGGRFWQRNESCVWRIPSTSNGLWPISGTRRVPLMAEQHDSAKRLDNVPQHSQQCAEIITRISKITWYFQIIASPVSILDLTVRGKK